MPSRAFSRLLTPSPAFSRLHSLLYWQFARANLIRDYKDGKQALPAPFNLLLLAAGVVDHAAHAVSGFKSAERKKMISRMKAGFKVVPTFKQQHALQRLERAALQAYMRQRDDEEKEGIVHQIEQVLDQRIGKLQRDNRRALEMILNAVGVAADARR